MFRILSSTFLVIILFAFSNGVSSTPENDTFVITDEALNHLQETSRANVLSQGEGLNVVELDVQQLHKVTEYMHHTKKICGGFTSVGLDLKEGWTPNEILQRETSDPFRILNSFGASLYPSEVRFETHVEEALQNVGAEEYMEKWEEFISFENRNGKSQSGVQASKWLESKALEIAAANNREVETRFFDTPNFKQPSLVVKVPGENPALPGVLVGAHMDTIVGWFGTTGRQPGADDDASGTIAVLEAYRSILETGKSFERDLYFAFYAAEEFGLHGSKVMSRKFVAENLDLRAVMQFDMVGYNSGQDDKEIYFITDYVDSTLTDYLVVLTKEYLKYKNEQIGYTKCGYACSDHASWHAQGYPTVYPFEASFENYNKKIHTKQDLIDRLDINHALKYVKLGISYMMELGEVAE